MWVFSEKKTDGISLHDCRATYARVEGGDLYFEFDDGFWVVANTEHNLHGNTLRTDKSLLKIENFEISKIYIFKEIRVFRRLVSTRRVWMSVDALVKKINTGKWELEFISEYHSGHEVLFGCWILFESRFYHRECQLFIRYDAMGCFWNRLREDCPW